MKTVGIIAEYNPFHNGHAYQITQAKELTGADYCIVVMSGNFVQRGVPAVMDKFLRTRAALMNGADLILELPVHYATASAEYFASGAVALLDKLGVTDCLCFGSECGDLQMLSTLSDLLLSENEEYKKILKHQLNAGYSYPKARHNALCTVLPQSTEDLDILRFPNNILGLEYLNSIKRRNSPMKPYTLPRIGSDYHDMCIDGSYSSAQAIRESIISQGTISLIRKQVPASAYELMEENYQKTFPILPEDISSMLFYKLISEQENGFDRYFDVSPQFSDRISRFLFTYGDYSSLCNALKSKNITYTKVARNLLHILLNIYQNDMDVFCKEDYIYYARMLGFRKAAEPLLSAIKSNTSIPLISKLADVNSRIPTQNGREMLKQDIQASHIYAALAQHKFHHGIQHEYQKQVVIL